MDSGLAPTFERFVDTDDVDVVSWDEAYEISCKACGYTPDIARPAFLQNLEKISKLQ